MPTILHFQDLKTQQNLICSVITGMDVLFRIATSVRFNYFIPHCFVCCATIIALSIIELFIWIVCWQMVLLFLNHFWNIHVTINTRLSDLLLPFDLFYFIVRWQKSSFPHHLNSTLLGGFGGMPPQENF